MSGPIPDALLDSRMDRVLEALLTQRRRMILCLLKRSSPRPIVDFLPRNTPANRSTEIELRHNDLPRLASLAYIDWDREIGEVARGERFGEVAPVLDLFENHADELPADWGPV